MRFVKSMLIGLWTMKQPQVIRPTIAALFGAMHVTNGTHSLNLMLERYATIDPTLGCALWLIFELILIGRAAYEMRAHAPPILRFIKARRGG